MKPAFLAALVMLAGASCANGEATPTGPGDDASVGPTGDGGTTSDGGKTGDGSTCDGPCDTDHDGVPDQSDQCPNTAPNSKVNKNGCADSQLTAKPEPNFPPYSLTWTPTGDAGRAGGLTWNYTGIQRADLFHIWWLFCDDKTYACGVSLDGPIDAPGETWTFDANDSVLGNGKIVFTNTTNILLADSTTRPLNGRLTMTLVDENNLPVPFGDIGTLGITTAQNAKYGAEIKGTGFTLNVLIEVEDSITSTWTPYLDYDDAQQTPDNGDGGADGGGLVQVSFGGTFYDK